jgi:putative flippase GtrA
MSSSRRDNGPRGPALSETEEPQPSEAQQTFFRWLKFNAVGAIGVIVQLMVLAVFRSWLKLDYLPATALAVELTVIHNFLWHERFTWPDRPSVRRMQWFARMIKFNVSNGAISLVGNIFLMSLLVGELKFNYLASNMVAIVSCSLVNFLLGDRFVFGAVQNSTAVSKQR